MITIKRSFTIFFLCMLIAPAYALDIQRPEIRAFIDKMAKEHGLKKSETRALLRKAETKQAILDAISRPAERVIPWYEYRERFMTPPRIAKGLAFQQQHAEKIERLRAAGAPVAEILGILGVETIYGENTGRYRVLDALATLAFDYPPRSEFFLGELEQFLVLSKEQKLKADAAVGSYAGAMGPPQFMPSSYRKYAVDGDGDGKRDLWSDWDDVIASVANYLQQFGWRAGEPVLAEATLDTTDLSAFAINTGGREIDLNETVGSLRAKGVRFQTVLPDDAPALLFALQGREGPLYRVGFNNFYVITRYNRSTMYASAVFELGQALTGAAPSATR